MKQGMNHWGAIGTLAIAYLAASHPSFAQVIPDNTLKTNSLVAPSGNTSVITNGTPNGTNLFHSFSSFSVLTGNTAYFNNALNIQNIITRVTGKSISNIDGTLKANGSANLFLINPNGIVFGPNAQLNIGGSFLASSASSLKFADGSEFSATNPSESPLLTVSVPIGLQFGQNPGKIIVRGTGNNLSYEPTLGVPDPKNRPVGLQVPEGKTLAIVGGDIVLEGGNLTAEAGRIELGSVGSGSDVTLSESGWMLGYSEVGNFQDIRLSRAASASTGGSGGGNIQVVGRQVAIAEGSAILSMTEGSNAGGILSVYATELVELFGTTADGHFPSNILALTAPDTTGKAGNIIIETARLLVQNGAQIGSGTFGSGDGGNLTVWARDSVELIGTSANGKISSGLASSNQPNSTGNAGNLTIETRRLIVREGAGLGSNTFGPGNAGTVTIKATDFVDASGVGGLTVAAAPTSTGKAGDLTVETGQLMLRDRASISVKSQGMGAAGDLVINAGMIRLDRLGLLTAITKSSGGNIILNSPDLQMRGNSSITTDATGKATGGNITINTKTLAALENSDITANSLENFGGKVTINARGIFGTEDRSSTSPLTSDITASSALGASFSGTVEINTPDIAPTAGLLTLPSNLVDVSQLIASECEAFARGSSFVVTGKGGLPLNPHDPLVNSAVIIDWATLEGRREKGEGRREENIISNASYPIVEATGWTRNDRGQVVLIAHAPTGNFGENWYRSPSCQGER